MIIRGCASSLDNEKRNLIGVHPCKGKEWIRIPSIIYSSTMLTNVTIILSEEIGGIHATPQPGVVLLENLPWLLFPIYIIYRMWRYPTPFSRPGEVVENLALVVASRVASKERNGT